MLLISAWIIARDAVCAIHRMLAVAAAAAAAGPHEQLLHSRSDLFYAVLDDRQTDWPVFVVETVQIGLF